jgi:hypothetical protein
MDSFGFPIIPENRRRRQCGITQPNAAFPFWFEKSLGNEEETHGSFLKGIAKDSFVYSLAFTVYLPTALGQHKYSSLLTLSTVAS